eukprot:TRINITY_DN11459_c0_g1_i1.p1 TRINITY_DN11459_c0_g1~~TRINITY_DN11459_c0_g1_i1.p1  ORF type:complete len:277 (-),score=31.34 TRINITY_DN11459_c0_g1_i1:104-934(-)
MPSKNDDDVTEVESADNKMADGRPGNEMPKSADNEMPKSADDKMAMADLATALPQGMSDKALEELGLSLIRKAKTSSRAAGRGLRSPCDPIFTHPTTGASVYCGGWSAVDNLESLGTRNILRVVNCQDPSSENHFQQVRLLNNPESGAWDAVDPTTADPDTLKKTFEIQYHRFHINGLEHQKRKNHEQYVYDQFLEYWTFLDSGLEKGESGIIHCAAGMHRAGGASVAYLMWKHKLSYEKALQLAQSKRSVINPYHRNSLKVVEHRLRNESPSEFS